MSGYNEYSDFLEENGIRPSSQRILMLKYLSENKEHPTADKIYVDLSQTLPTISKATVYNNLKLFLNKGIINEVSIDNNEAHYDMVGKDHAHFICKECKKIKDLEIEGLKINTSEIEDYDIQNQDIYLTGVCKSCLDKKNNN